MATAVNDSVPLLSEIQGETLMILKSHMHKSASVSYSLIKLVHQPFTLARKKSAIKLPPTVGGDDSEASSSQIAWVGKRDRGRTRTGTHLDAPRVGGLVERVLHDLTDNLALGEDLRKVLGAQHVPQGRRRKQPRGVTEI